MGLKFVASLSAFALLASGCISMAPKVPSPDAAVPDVAGAESETPTVDLVAWQDYFTDPALRMLIETALENNRDLRAAVLNVERARALYRVERAAFFPRVNGSFSYQRLQFGDQGFAPGFGGPGGGPGGGGGGGFGGGDQGDGPIEFYNASVGLSGYEVDLFGRVKSLNNAALATYFSSDETRRAATVSLIAEVANAYLLLTADRALLTIAEETVTNQEDALALTTRRFEGGVGNRVAVEQVRTAIERARADMATLEAQVRRDENGLRLLLGVAQLPAIEAPNAPQDVTLADELPPAVSSTVLLQRPDVRAAEYSLAAANANIGAARAAFFPRLSLTANDGVGSQDLDNLFGEGAETWTFSPSVSVPLFTAGALRGQLAASKLERDAALANYERAIQVAFRDVADALAIRATIDRRLSATQRLLEATDAVYTLRQDQYESGVTDFLAVLDAQRENYNAERELVSVQLARAANVVTVYRSLGGASLYAAPEDD